MPAATSLPYEARVAAHTNPAARDLLELMARKRTNLCVSVDVTTKGELLRIVRAVGPSICMVKTHCDIIEDFDADLVAQLTALAQELDFQIFEDRKFADIGNTVSLQYSSGVHKIASWSHITNAHIIPGPGIISGLADVGLPLGRGLLLLAEMSSEGSLAKGQYTLDCLRFARARRDFVIGFIAQSRVELLEARPEGVKEEEDDFLVMSPGVALGRTGDGKGQQYRTPTRVVEEAGADVIIVGRGIYGGADEKEWKEEAERYRTEGWAAYERRVGAVAK